MFRKALLSILVLTSCLSMQAQKPASTANLAGAWKAVTYVIAGKPLPMTGLMVFTDKFYSANVRFRLAPGPNEDANGNAGPYHLEGKDMVLEQWVQVHVRPEDPKEPILSHAGEPEKAQFEVTGDKLVMTFPSGNKWFLESIR